MDRSSVPVMIRSLLSRKIAEVEFAIRKRGEDPIVFLQLILRDVSIVEVEQSLAAGTDLAVEKIVLQPSEVSWRFVPEDETGAPGNPVEDGFDCIDNKRL